MVKATTKTARETSIKIIPASCPGVPAIVVCGGYSVQPAPVGPPPTKKLAIKMITEIKNVQTDIMFRKGKTMSLAPSMSGTM